MGSSIDETEIHIELTLPPNTNKQDYTGGSNYKTRDSQTHKYGDSQSKTDGCARNLDDEYKGEENEDYTDPPSKKNIELNQNYKKKSGIGYYPKKNLSKLSKRLCLTLTTMKMRL